MPSKAGNVRESGSFPGWGRCPGGGHGNPLQNSCLDREAGGGGGCCGKPSLRTACIKQKSSTSGVYMYVVRNNKFTQGAFTNS